MDKIKVLILEDEVIVAEEIKAYLEDCGYKVVGITVSKEEALKVFHQTSPDIALLDINIKGKMVGLEVAGEFRSIRPCVIIFLTAYTDQLTLKRAKEVNPEAYLVKPLDTRNLAISIDIAFNNFLTRELAPGTKEPGIDEYVYVRENNRYIRLDISDIYYIKAARSYCEVVTSTKTYTFTFNLKNFESRINHKDLIRVHRSYVINKNQVKGIEANKLLIRKTWIEVGESYKKEVFKHFPTI